MCKWSLLCRKWAWKAQTATHSEMWNVIHTALVSSIHPRVSFLQWGACRAYWYSQEVNEECFVFLVLFLIRRICCVKPVKVAYNTGKNYMLKKNKSWTSNLGLKCSLLHKALHLRWWAVHWLLKSLSFFIFLFASCLITLYEKENTGCCFQQKGRPECFSFAPSQQWFNQQSTVVSPGVQMLCKVKTIETIKLSGSKTLSNVSLGNWQQDVKSLTELQHIPACSKRGTIYLVRTIGNRWVDWMIL